MPRFVDSFIYARSLLIALLDNLQICNLSTFGLESSEKKVPSTIFVTNGESPVLRPPDVAWPELITHTLHSAFGKSLCTCKRCWK
jgi:hypothetical protein